MDIPAGTPHESAILQRDPVAPRTARALAISALEAWGLLDVRDDVELVVSELVTNALRPGTRIAFLIALRSGTGEVEVAVWDDGPGLPEPKPQGLEAESGRGLFIVKARSNDWGWRRSSDGIGKVIWATLGPKPREDHDAAP
jgi:anti-sigma regulatory factor (Ser/Thr protein kinase)